MDPLQDLSNAVIGCGKCPRLSRYIKEIAETKVKRFINDQYWGKPLPGFGDPNARLLIVGLAPAAHGGNRTGRMFTGDSSGDWLMKALYEAGFSNQPTSIHKNDRLQLRSTYITAAVRCAPPGNRPLAGEIANCSEYLQSEVKILNNVSVIVTLGRIAFDALTKLLPVNPKPQFKHGLVTRSGSLSIIASYHPSRQNTQTRKLTWKMWTDIFSKAREILEEAR